jgi:hypothetical protein
LPTVHVFPSNCRLDPALTNIYAHCRLSYCSIVVRDSLSLSITSVQLLIHSPKALKRMASGASRASIIQPMRNKSLFHQASQGSSDTSRCSATHVHKNIVEAQLKTMLGTVRQSWMSLQVVEDDIAKERGEEALMMRRTIILCWLGWKT